jgi:DNA-binding transcriptional ArsR family regulator
MENHSSHLSATFHALAHSTRRAVLHRLGRGPATITELATPFDIALPSFMKHIRLLEASGWIRSYKGGRIRTCSLRKKQFTTVEDWLAQQRAVLDAQTDRRERFVAVAQKEGKPKRHSATIKVNSAEFLNRIIRAPRAEVCDTWTNRAASSSRSPCVRGAASLRCVVAELGEGDSCRPHACCIAGEHGRGLLVGMNAAKEVGRPAEHPFKIAV